MKLDLIKEVYAREALDAAIGAFGALARISVSEDGAYWRCVFEECVHDPQRTADEFENYLLDLLNEGRHGDR